MKKIGIILESTNCDKYLFETVSTLSQSNQVELFFLLNNCDASQKGFWQSLKSKIINKGLLRFIELFFFRLISASEYRILSLFSKHIKEHGRIFSINQFITNDRTYLNPIFSTSGLIVHYPDNDICVIKSLNLDIIIRGNAPGIFKGKILNAAQEGIISFHHGDNRWNRGGPPAFWEVFFRKPTTGFIIQILSEELDSGSVIFRGEITTHRSFTENIIALYNTGNPYLSKIILDYAANGHLPVPEESTPFGGPLLVLPAFSQLIRYLLRTCMLFILLLINRIVLLKYERWGVAFIAGSWRNAIFRKGIQIKNPPNHFFADPFVITKNGRTVCYVEDYCNRMKRACITAIEIVSDKDYKVIGHAIEEPFHLSFPYIFEYQQTLYMIPETLESNSIRIYKCIEFPMKWEYQKDILTGVKAVDSMIFEHCSKWWLFTNIDTKEDDNYCSQLFAFYSSHPLSDEWVAHEQNPLVFNSSIGRNGGLLDAESANPVRVRQKQGFNSYGSALTLARINDLTASSFNEQEIGQVSPDFFPRIKGCHHIHSDGKYTVYDYLLS